MVSGWQSETLTAYQAAVREIEHDSSNSGGDRGSHREQQTAATATAAATTAAAAAEEKPAETTTTAAAEAAATTTEAARKRKEAVRKKELSREADGSSMWEGCGGARCLDAELRRPGVCLRCLLESLSCLIYGSTL